MSFYNLIIEGNTNIINFKMQLNKLKQFRIRITIIIIVIVINVTACTSRNSLYYITKIYIPTYINGTYVLYKK